MDSAIIKRGSLAIQQTIGDKARTRISGVWQHKTSDAFKDELKVVFFHCSSLLMIASVNPMFSDIIHCISSHHCCSFATLNFRSHVLLRRLTGTWAAWVRNPPAHHPFPHLSLCAISLWSITALGTSLRSIKNIIIRHLPVCLLVAKIICQYNS